MKIRKLICGIKPKNDEKISKYRICRLSWLILLKKY